MFAPSSLDHLSGRGGTEVEGRCGRRGGGWVGRRGRTERCMCCVVKIGTTWADKKCRQRQLHINSSHTFCYCFRRRGCFGAASCYPASLTAFPSNKYREGKRGRKVRSFFLGALQLQGALTNPAVTRTQSLSLDCPSFPLTPCSWLLGVVNQHPLAPWRWGLFGTLPKTPVCPSNEAWAPGLSLMNGSWSLQSKRPALEKVWLNPWAMRAKGGICVKSSKQARF